MTKNKRFNHGIYLSILLLLAIVFFVFLFKLNHIKALRYLKWFLLFVMAGITYLYVNWFNINRFIKASYRFHKQIEKSIQGLKSGDYHKVDGTNLSFEQQVMIGEMNDAFLQIAKEQRANQYYNNQFTDILNTMNQAIILINRLNQVIYFNEDTKKIFQVTDKEKNKKYYEVFRNYQLLEAIELANKDLEEKAFDLEAKKEIYLVNIYPIGKNKDIDRQPSVLVTLKNVTQLRQIENIKKDFFAHASHELKSPLTAILGYAELIEQHLITEDELNDIAKKVMEQGHHMNLLLDDMLMLSRLEIITDETYQAIEIHHLLDQVIAQLTPLAEKKQMTLQCQTEKVLYQGSPLDFQKVFKNIIENAIHYSNPGQNIELILKNEEGQFTFTCIDQGIGIAEKHQDRIFERFYRIDKGRLDKGTGLGLAIVKHVLIKYHGHIKLKSKLNIGTTITVIFPYND